MSGLEIDKRGAGRGDVLEERLDIEIRQMMFFLCLRP